MRRLLIGTVAAVALSAWGAAPAQAHHDTVCAPVVPGPLCITGLQHAVPETQDALWAEYRKVVEGPGRDTAQTGHAVIAMIPDPLCVGPDFAPLCLTGLRGLAATGYDAAGGVAWLANVGVCLALGQCPVVLP